MGTTWSLALDARCLQPGQHAGAGPGPWLEPVLAPMGWGEDAERWPAARGAGWGWAPAAAPPRLYKSRFPPQTVVPAPLGRRSGAAAGRHPEPAVAAVPAGEGSPQPGGSPQQGWGRGQAPRHGLHHAAPRGCPRALPRPQHSLRGRGEPERERHIGPVVWLLRGRRGSPQAATKTRANGDGEAEAGGQRTGAGPDPERQYGLHRPADPHPHRASGSEAVQDRDPPPGLQLYLPPGQCAAAGRGLRRRAALFQCHLRGQGRPGQQAAPQHLHLLPQQSAERGQPEGPRGQLPKDAGGDPPASVTEMSQGPAAPT